MILVPVAALLFSGSASVRALPPQPVEGPQALLDLSGNACPGPLNRAGLVLGSSFGLWP